jgi:AcrR family transcriptional regulator
MPKIVDHVAYKNKLVEQSFEIMATRGYYSLSMRDLARTLRVSTGTLYHYFGSKLGLFEAILHAYGVDEMNKKRKLQLPSASFEAGLDLLIQGCEQQEKLWAKVLLIQVDAYREPDGQMMNVFNSVFTSEKTRAYMHSLLHIENTDVIDLIRALMLGIIIQRVISNKPVNWTAQKLLLRDNFAKYASTASN